MNKETVTITKKKYDRLVDAARTLAALEAHGVDNWEGYYEAIGELDDDEDEEDE